MVSTKKAHETEILSFQMYFVYRNIELPWLIRVFEFIIFRKLERRLLIHAVTVEPLKPAVSDPGFTSAVLHLM